MLLQLDSAFLKRFVFLSCSVNLCKNWGKLDEYYELQYFSLIPYVLYQNYPPPHGILVTEIDNSSLPQSPYRIWMLYMFPYSFIAQPFWKWLINFFLFGVLNWAVKSWTLCLDSFIDGTVSYHIYFAFPFLHAYKVCNPSYLTRSSSIFCVGWGLSTIEHYLTFQ